MLRTLLYDINQDSTSFILSEDYILEKAQATPNEDVDPVFEKKRKSPRNCVNKFSTLLNNARDNNNTNNNKSKFYNKGEIGGSTDFPDFYTSHSDYKNPFPKDIVNHKYGVINQMNSKFKGKEHKNELTIIDKDDNQSEKTFLKLMDEKIEKFDQLSPLRINILGPNNTYSYIYGLGILKC